MKKKMNLTVKSRQYDLNSSMLFDSIADELFRLYSRQDGDEQKNDGENESECDSIDDAGAFDDAYSGDEITLVTEAEYTDDGDRVELSYVESELTECAGQKTTVSFLKSEPDIVTVYRTGEITTVLVLEKGQRHISSYETPYLPFELCTRARKIKNNLSPQGGKLYLDYIVELKGAAAQRSVISFILKKDALCAVDGEYDGGV